MPNDSAVTPPEDSDPHKTGTPARTDSGGDDPDARAGSKSALDAIEPWVLSLGFLLVVALFIAATLIGLLVELTDKQQAVYQGIFTVGAAVIGAVFGVKIQSPQTERAEAELDTEKEKTRRKLSDANAKTTAVIAREAKAASTRVTVIPPEPESVTAETIRAAREGDQLIYVQSSPEDLPPPLDAGGLVAAVDQVFDEVAEEE
jgi:hypothetical protein